MALVELKIEVPKEMNDIRVFLVQLISDIKAKKPTTEIIAGSLGGLMASIEGFDQLDEEAKMKEAYNLYGILAADIAKALAGK
jgi:hypothetical protein